MKTTFGLCFLLASPLAAQTTLQDSATLLPLQPFDAENGRVAHWSYDLATGEVQRIAAPPKGQMPLLTRADATRTENPAAGSGCFANDDGVYEVSTHPVTHQELVDWGVKDCGGRCRVTSFTFTYRTGLPNVDLSIAFYVGTTGFGELGTQIRRFSFTGLPAGFLDEQPDVPPNQFQNTLTVDLSSAPMCLPDGPIGWSFTNDDLDSGIFLNRAPNAPLGVLDALDVYDNPPATNGAYVGTFNFASQMPVNDVGSIRITLEEEDAPNLAGVQLLRGSGANPLALLPSDIPVLGRTMFAKPSLAEVPGANLSTFVLSWSPSTPLQTIAGEILIDLVSPPLLIDTSSSAHRLDIPISLAMGTAFYGQAIFTGPGVLQLTNAITLLVGA